MDYDKREKNKFYAFENLWQCGVDNEYHYNYKTLLAGQRKESKERQEKLNRYIKSRRKQIKQLEVELNEVLEARKLYKEDVKIVDKEYSYRKKIVALENKHPFLCVSFDGDSDVYTTWVWGDYDDGDENDPYYDAHFHDSYQDAYFVCLEYINLHNKKMGVNND